MKRYATPPGMTLIEVIATVAILSIITILAVPAFRGLQGRQSLLTTQKGIQSQFYRLLQLSLAPTSSPGTQFEVVGYGLSFVKKQSGATTDVGGCHVMTRNDLVSLHQIVRLPTGEIQSPLVDVQSPSTGECAENIDPRSYPNTFYELPRYVSLSESSTPNVPWFVVEPLVAVADRYGNLCQVGCFTSGYTQPLATTSLASLRLAYSGISDPNQRTKHLCREVVITQDATIQAKGTILTGGCL